MADVKFSGGQTTGALSGKLIFEQDNNRIVQRDDANRLILIIGTLPDGTSGIATAKPGQDLEEAFAA
jgi:hypothetical protein